jgi:hypothetical protein
MLASLILLLQDQWRRRRCSEAAVGVVAVGVVAVLCH